MLDKRTILLNFVLFIGLNCLAQINFEFNSSYQYLKGSEANNLPNNWMSKSYNISTWSKANAPFRYGDGDGGYVLDDMQNNYSTLYLRSTFNAQNIVDLQKITFRYNFDDGFILWINGQEVISKNAPGDLSNTSFSTDQHESGGNESTNIKIEDIQLKEGENLIAVQGFNVNLSSTDFYFDLKIEATPEGPVLPEVPDSIKVMFSKKGSFYDAPFSLTMEVPDKAYDIVYTIDGSNPQTSTSAKNGGKSVAIDINPASTNGRAKTPCFIVRASLRTNELAPSIPTSQTYIFISEVIRQKHPGGDFPTTNVNGQSLDWEMDEDITSNSRYKNDIDDALLAIPSISVVTDNAALFDSGEGIYVNAEMHGIDWERLCSVELINPDGSVSFNENAGLRIRGGWSRHDGYPKHAFRLFFRDEYGNSKLNFPLFGDEGVDSFDKVDLRTAQNYAWSNNQGHNTFVREVFSRDTQRDMGQPYTRSRYYHLYLNGMYWGLFQTQERSEARYAESYFGGQKEDYDVVKVNGDFSYNIEATDGNLDKWQEVWNSIQKGFSSNKNYFELEGKDSNGVPKKNAEIMVDIDNLIDYMIIIFFGGNFDAPSSKFSGDQNPNNFYAITKRDDKTKGFQFYVHDAEHSLLSEAVGPGIGIEENRVEIPGMRISNFSKFHPQWLHQKLTANAEYRLRFADRVEKHFLHNGALTLNNCEERFLSRAKEIEMAIIAESARWGDGTGGNNPKTKFDHWKPEIDEVVNNYFPERIDIVLDQLVDADLYTTTNSPEYKVNNKLVDEEEFYFNETTDIVFVAANSSADIYYTTDGSDPRKVGGDVRATAKKVNNGETIKLHGTTVIKGRVKSGNEWSAIHTVRFIKHWEDYYNLKVTELNYHPTDSIIGLDTISGKSFEFIEFKNVGSHAVDLSKLNFLTSIDFHFGPDAVIYPNNFYVLASSSKWFYERYGRVPSAVYKNAFSNSGEVVTVMSDNGRVVFGFEYKDQNPWPVEVDSTGYTLTSVQVYPMGDPNSASYWRASSFINGSPFFDDTGFRVGKVDELTDTFLLQVYPNPASDYLYLKINGEEAVNTEIYTLTGRKVFSEQLHNNAIIDLLELNIQPGILLVKTNCKGEQKNRKILFRR